MRSDLGDEEKELLIRAVTTPSHPLDAAVGNGPHWKALQDKGLIWPVDGKSVTDRGLVTAIVQCNQSFNEVRKVKSSLDSYTKYEQQMFKQIFTSEEIDKVFFARFKVILDMDLFDSNNAFAEPHANEGYKMSNLVMLELARNTTIPIQKLLRMMQVPNAKINTREELIVVLERANEMA